MQIYYLVINYYFILDKLDRCYELIDQFNEYRLKQKFSPQRILYSQQNFDAIVRSCQSIQKQPKLWEQRLEQSNSKSGAPSENKGNAQPLTLSGRPPAEDGLQKRINFDSA